MKVKSKIYILFAMRKWPLNYILWRMDTAYPNGWKYIILNPLVFIKDLLKYLSWCQMIDENEKK